MQVGVSRYCMLHNGIIVESWWGVHGHGVKSLKNFGLFTSGGQLNRTNKIKFYKMSLKTQFELSNRYKKMLG